MPGTRRTTHHRASRNAPTCGIPSVCHGMVPLGWIYFFRPCAAQARARQSSAARPSGLWISRGPRRNRARARSDFPQAGPRGACGPAESRRLLRRGRGRRRRWGDVRLRSFGCSRRLGGCIAVRVAAVWRARHQRRRMAPLRFSSIFCR